MAGQCNEVSDFLDKYGLNYEKNFCDGPTLPYINKNKAISFDVKVDLRQRWTFPVNIIPKGLGIYIISNSNSYINLRIKLGGRLVYNILRLRPGIYEGLYLIAFGTQDFETDFETFTIDITLWDCAYGVNGDGKLCHVFYYSIYTPRCTDRLRLFFSYASKLFSKNDSEISKAMKDQLQIECGSKYVKALAQALCYMSEAPFDFSQLPEKIEDFIESVNEINQLAEEANSVIDKNIEKLTKANMAIETFASKSIKSNDELEKDIQMKLLKLKNLEEKINELSKEIEKLEN